MKLAAVIVKTLKENIRDWKVLVMVLVFSPFFLMLMKLYFGGEPIAYKIGILDLDTGQQSIQLINNLQSSGGKDQAQQFQLSKLSNQQELELMVKEKTIDVGIVIPKDYSNKLGERATGKIQNPVIVEFYGSMGNMRYPVAAVLTADIIMKQGLEIAKISLPSTINETFMEKNQLNNEFDGYVPGLISLAVLMILFIASATIVKENDQNTLIRLKLSQLGAFNFLAGVSIVQALIATAAILLSYWTALGLGYKPTGNFWSILVVGLISSFSMVAISLVVASFLNTFFDVLTLGCFPFFILMFFSGSMFPLPNMELFSIGGIPLGITDILPLTHTVAAFNKILNYGLGISEVGFDLVKIAFLTVIYFVLGIVLYQKRKLSKA